MNTTYIVVVDFLKKHWKPLAVVAALALAFVFGRYSAAGPKVVETEKIVYQDREVKVVDEQKVQAEVDARVKVLEASLEKKVVTIVVTKKDGTKIEKTTTDVKQNTKVTENETKTNNVVDTTKTTETKVVEKEVEKTKTITPQGAEYKVGVLVGTQLLMDNYKPNLADTPILIGIGASRKLVGPLWLDANLLVGIKPVGVTQVNTVGLMIGVSAEF